MGWVAGLVLGPQGFVSGPVLPLSGFPAMATPELLGQRQQETRKHMDQEEEAPIVPYSGLNPSSWDPTAGKIPELCRNGHRKFGGKVECQLTPKRHHQTRSLFSWWIWASRIDTFPNSGHMPLALTQVSLPMMCCLQFDQEKG